MIKRLWWLYLIIALVLLLLLIFNINITGNVSRVRIPKETGCTETICVSSFVCPDGPSGDVFCIAYSPSITCNPGVPSGCLTMNTICDLPQSVPCPSANPD